MKSFWDFPEAVRNARISFTAEDDDFRQMDGYTFSVTKTGGNSVKVTFDVDLSVWSVPPHGKTMAVKLQVPGVRFTESTHRLCKVLRKDSEGNVIGLKLHTLVTPGEKTVHVSPLSELWPTKSEGVRRRRMRVRKSGYSYALS